jgi:hypothetical protein
LGRLGRVVAAVLLCGKARQVKGQHAEAQDFFVSGLAFIKSSKLFRIAEDNL